MLPIMILRVHANLNVSWTSRFDKTRIVWRMKLWCHLCREANSWYQSTDTNVGSACPRVCHFTGVLTGVICLPTTIFYWPLSIDCPQKEANTHVKLTTKQANSGSSHLSLVPNKRCNVSTELRAVTPCRLMHTKTEVPSGIFLAPTRRNHIFVFVEGHNILVSDKNVRALLQASSKRWHRWPCRDFRLYSTAISGRQSYASHYCTQIFTFEGFWTSAGAGMPADYVGRSLTLTYMCRTTDESIRCRLLHALSQSTWRYSVLSMKMKKFSFFFNLERGK